jgi:hypothetical protein
VRTHLGIETQRQWSDLAIARTTPALRELFSVVTLLADRSVTQGTLPIRQTAWYSQASPTFSEALVVAQHPLWQSMTFHTSSPDMDVAEAPLMLLSRLTEALCHAA